MFSGDLTHAFKAGPHTLDVEAVMTGNAVFNARGYDSFDHDDHPEGAAPNWLAYPHYR
jgi:hypothetical protein